MGLVKTEIIKIKGNEYVIGPMTLGHREWIQDTYGTDEEWNVKIGGNDIKALAATLWCLLDNSGRSHFKTEKAMKAEMQGDIGYMLLLYLKISKIYGVPQPSLDDFDMEDMGDSEIKLLQKVLSDEREMRKDEAASQQ